jgi:dipeptidase E
MLPDMRLYLSSCGLPHPAGLATLLERDSLVGAKAGLIPNARDGDPEEDARARIEKERGELEALGLEVTVLDLREQTPETLPAALAGLDLLWVLGGNNFCLRHAMREAGFDRIGAAAVEGGLVYAGESAGAIVAGPSLAPWADFDDPAPTEEHVDKGLWLVNFVAVPHWNSPGFEERAPGVLQAARDLGLEAIPIEDGQALVVDGQNVKMLY